MKASILWNSESFELRLEPDEVFESRALGQLRGRELTAILDSGLLRIVGLEKTAAEPAAPNPTKNLLAPLAKAPPPAPAPPSPLEQVIAANEPNIPELPPPAIPGAAAQNVLAAMATVPRHELAAIAQPENKPPKSPLLVPPMGEGFPETEEAAIAFCAGAGVTPEFAVKCYRKAAARGGRDSRDVPIRSFGHYLAIERTYQQEHDAQDKAQKHLQENSDSGEPRVIQQRRPRSTYELTQALDMKRERLTQLRNEHSRQDQFGHRIYDDPAHLTVAKKLVAEIKELKAAIESNAAPPSTNAT